MTERVRDVLAAGSKVIVFTSFTEGLKRHGQTFGAAAVTISGEKTVEERMAAVDRFQADDGVRVAICNLVAGGVGLNLTAATYVIFQDLDWVPANHLQAEDRAYRWVSASGSRSSTCSRTARWTSTSPTFSRRS